MSAAPPISAEEYLAASCRPGCDFVDDEVIERNAGTKDHSKRPRGVMTWFRDRRELRLAAFPEPDERILAQPPYASAGIA
jgi:hypothetical protein